MNRFVLLGYMLFVFAYGAESGSFGKVNYSNIQKGPDITVRVGGLTSSKVHAAVFKWQSGLQVDWNRALDTTTYAVKSFRYHRQNNDGSFREEIDGCDFTETVLQDIAKAKAGDTIYLDKILVTTSSGELLRMGALIYTLL